MPPSACSAAQTARAKAEVALAERHQVCPRQGRRSSAALRRLDTVKDRHGKIARLQKQMETATSSAQITALEHEIAVRPAKPLAKLEDDELESHGNAPTSPRNHSRRAPPTSLADTTASLEAPSAPAPPPSLTQQHRLHRLPSSKPNAQTLRTLIASNRPRRDALLSSYDRIAKAKGTALSEALDHKCTACQMMVRPQRWNDLTDRDPNAEFANTIFSCETCGRMLFYDPRTDSPTPWPPGDRLKAALHP